MLLATPGLQPAWQLLQIAVCGLKSVSLPRGLQGDARVKITAAGYTPARWIPATIALALGAIIVVPMALERARMERMDEAADLVDHTNEVRATARRVAFTMRDYEAAVFSLQTGIDNERIRARLQAGPESLENDLQRLTALIRDDPEQILRLGRLRSLSESRRALLADAVRFSDAGEAYQAWMKLDEMLTLFPIAGVLDEIVDAEERMLGARMAAVDGQRARMRWVALITMVLQLLTLLLITAFLWRLASRLMAARGELDRTRLYATAIVQAVGDPLALLDHDQRVVLSNAAFEEVYGGCPPGTPLADAAAGSWNQPAVLQRLRDVLQRQRELWDYELRQDTAHGEQRTMRINARPIEMPGSAGDLVLLSASDITLQKASEEQILELNEQLTAKIEQVSEANRELEAFSYSVSHDLRAPLRHIAGFAGRLAAHLGDGQDEKTTHYLQVIRDAAERMASLIDDLLVYSRLGRSALRLQPVDQQTLVAEIRAMLDDDHGGPPVDWRIGQLPVVVADENMLRQVWQNLLGNALKYSATRERIEIGIDCQRHGNAWRFSVRDNGAGFDMQYAGKLFGVFQRLHRASEYPGTGVGLAITRRVLVRHGGRIWAESAPDQGATFYFELPAGMDGNRREVTH